jgi:hypothetical protein
MSPDEAFVAVFGGARINITGAQLHSQGYVAPPSERGMIESAYPMCFLPLEITFSDEGMTNGPSTFAYLAFRPRGDTIEGITKPMKMTAWRGPGT